MTYVAPRSWEDAAPGNVAGVTSALTTVGAMPRRVLRYQRIKFVIRRFLGPPAKLERLSFIHYARTALITRDADGSKLEPAYVYFESHFNGSFDAYIDAFAYVVPKHLRRIWDDAYDFEGPQPAEQFKRYIREHDYPAAHLYAAYPEATASDIHRALTLKRRMQPLARRVEKGTAKKFADRFYERLPEPKPRTALSTVVRSMRLCTSFWLRRRDPNFAVGGHAYGLSSLVPIADGATAALTAALHQLDRPFDELPRTHFARLVVIDRFPSPAAQPDAPTPGPCLLLSCVIDGRPDPFLRQLYHASPGLVDAIWDHCGGPAKPEVRSATAFAQWLRAHQLKTTTFFAPYPDATVEQVKDALAFARELDELAGTAHHGTETALRRRFEPLVDPRTWRLL
jgi:hypothetical protein